MFYGYQSPFQSRLASSIAEAVATQRAAMAKDRMVDNMYAQRMQALNARLPSLSRRPGSVESTETVPVAPSTGPNWRLVGAALFLTIAGIGAYTLWRSGKGRTRRRK